ncbi:MAG: GIY-YIG nuclease family protein [Nanoarchaeota archaeon]|nr:GIY-YIG nuclease family protein [Nanoarchaeota archaeon]MBU1445367.1 GIY-YIG nuclease family protein [Nanoarchaeota archaeon]MBU2406814.1 GIY-YIG nuclease family protein [Nanoarchaeota archaeon]MBU2420140.1 GIY-YIG nuclease family protein [Nanoarchaeota archaeon]
MKTTFYVYILLCKDNSYYTGYTNNLKNRIKKHKEGIASKYIRSKGFKELVYFETHPTKESAMKREYAIKNQNKAYKNRLVSEFQRNSPP